ncbi:MAG: outer membrane lipid asymmetry maintenance protein MlaD [Rhodospirillaceae bacterium]|nr:outer membrane lipid asymmetry maintenance protein MlaD [Rhodospirillaceae bacterium]MCA8933125.1 outer membrane lipid asymmetry maintenance protein MlaD [Rhodospirillaceae bacterium]
MHHNVIESVMGAVVLVVAALFLVFAYTSADLGAVEGYVVEARFDQITGLTTGSDVTISGVRVGSVVDTALDPNTYQAVVRMSIDPAITLHTDASATVASEGLLGGMFVQIDPGGGYDEVLEPGGEISYTQSTPGLEQLLGQVIFSLESLGRDDQ